MSVSPEPLKLNSRRLWMHKGIVAPDFSSEHVLSQDPWLYVELWLKKKGNSESLSYWKQARRFAEASAQLGPEAAPLTNYYAFLNATKALLAAKCLSGGNHHGVGGERPDNARANLTNEKVNFKTGGVLPDLCRYLGESTAAHTYCLKDILWNIPFIHRAFRLTFTASPELFIPLENARYVRKAGSTEAWFEAEVIKRFADNRMLKNIPDSFQIIDRDEKKIVRRKKRFKWHKARDNKPEKDRSIARLVTYHGTTRRVIVNISGNRDLWYLKRHQDRNNVGMRHTLVLMFAAMHRLSELSRYDPSGLEKHLSGQANWLLTEFISGAMDQFIDQIGSEITGSQFWPSKVR